MPEPPTNYDLLRKALGSKWSCQDCPAEFYIYRSDIHHVSEALPVLHCPYCGGPVELA